MRNINELSLICNTCPINKKYILIADDDTNSDYIVTTKNSEDKVLSKAPYSYGGRDKFTVLTKLVNAYYGAGYTILKRKPIGGEFSKCYERFER